jgi:hypothetical protein
MGTGRTRELAARSRDGALYRYRKFVAPTHLDRDPKPLGDLVTIGNLELVKNIASC